MDKHMTYECISCSTRSDHPCICWECGKGMVRSRQSRLGLAFRVLWLTAFVWHGLDLVKHSYGLAVALIVPAVLVVAGIAVIVITRKAAPVKLDQSRGV
jgi:uncharacterized membrane protein (UPF0136 family)